MRSPVFLVLLPAAGMCLRRPGIGKDGGLWLVQSMQICAGLLQRMLRARPEDSQAQGRARKPYWPRGVHGDKPLQTFQDHPQAVLPELFLRRAEIDRAV